MTVHECETMGVFLRFIRRAIKHLNRCVYSVITALMKRESGLLAHLDCVYVCVCMGGMKSVKCPLLCVKLTHQSGEEVD